MTVTFVQYQLWQEGSENHDCCIYNRESELFDGLAMTSRKALKSLAALQRDNEKLNAAEKELQQEIKELQRDVQANTSKNFEKAKRSKEAHKNSNGAEGEV